MSIDDALADAPTAAPSLTGAKGKPKICTRHDWEPLQDANGEFLVGYWCRRCGREKDHERSRRGKNNRSRGNSIERDVCKLLGIPRVGQYGGSADGGDSASWLVVQVKSGGTYPERIDLLLRALPVTAAQLRGVVHADTPGPGGKRRMLITLDLVEFADWFGSR